MTSTDRVGRDDTVSRYYVDPRERDRYARDDPYDLLNLRNWSGPSRTRSPESRRYDDDRYNMERRERDDSLRRDRERDRYDERRHDLPYRDRDGEVFDRRGPHPTRRDYKDRERERERDFDYYDRAPPPPTRSQWNAAQASERSYSPQTSRRSPLHPDTRRPSSPYSAPRPPISSSIEKREGYVRRTSQSVVESEAAIHRDQQIPTGPRAASSTYSRSNAIPPAGPKSSYARPSSNSTQSYEGRQDESNPILASRRYPDEEASSKAQSIRPNEVVSSESASGLPATTTTGSLDTSGWDEPLNKLPLDVSESQNEALLVNPSIPVKDRLGELKGSDFVGSSHPDLEAQSFNTSTIRLQSIHAMYARPEFVALRKAVYGLADCEVELAGAKTRISITEAALAAAKEEAEAWCLESARIEVKEKNSSASEWFNVKVL